MKTIENLIRENIQGKKVLLVFALTSVVYLTMLLATIPKVMSHGGGMRLLDMIPMGYDIEYVKNLLDALGQQGREAYLYNQIPLDMIYPALFAISYCLVLGYFLNKLDKLRASLIFLCLLPFGAGAMDYGENIGIIIMLKGYPSISNGIVTITSCFSILKSICTSFYFLILIGSLILLGIKTLKR